MTLEQSAVDHILYDDLGNATYHPGLRAGKKLKFHGQAGNTVAANSGNQGVGTVALPALAAAATGTVTISDNLITAISLVFCQVRAGTTTAAAGAVGTLLTSVRAPVSGSVVVDVTNLGTAATLTTDYQLWYEVVN